jgi:glycosyltransferase involved in cell wall biosynthesis
MTKLKALFVVMNFSQTGAPRYAYEIDRALNHNDVEVHLLSLTPLTGNQEFGDYYYKLHRAAGSQVHFYKPSMSRRLRASFSYRLNTKIFNVDRKLMDFLGRFDVVNWIGAYTLDRFPSVVPKEIIDRSLVHILASKRQFYPDEHIDYLNFPSGAHYNFVSSFKDENAIKFELGSFTDFSHTYFPIALDIDNAARKWKFRDEKETTRIAVFGRLDKTRPIGSFFAAVNLLASRIPNVQLHIWGAGDPETEGLTRLIRNFHVDDRVWFRGHAQDIVEIAIDEKIDLVWYQSFYGFPAGYAGYDLCLAGIPQIYWELLPDIDGAMNEVDGYPCFTQLDKFVEQSWILLTDGDSAKEQSDCQIKTTADNQDIKKWICKLEEKFRSIVEAGQSRYA